MTNQVTHQTHKRLKHKIRDVRSFEDLRAWWHTVVDVKVKAIVLTGLIASFVVVGFQYQVNALTNERIDAQCTDRVTTVTDVRELMQEMVDLTDVLPGDELAEEYTESRLLLIDRLYPPVTRADCR